MAFEQKDVENLAKLARLGLSSNDEAAKDPFALSIKDDLNNILSMLEHVSQCPTGDIEPLAHPLPGAAQKLREDTVTESQQRDDFLSIAPNVDSGLYLVPQVLDES